MYNDIPTRDQWKKDTPWLRRTGSARIIEHIDNSLFLYHNEKSDASRQRLLKDIQRKLGGLNSISKLNASYKDLKNVVQKVLSEHTLHARTYGKVTCIGWRVFCDAELNLNYRAKCREMWQAIKVARSLVDAEKSDSRDALKIFIAPEFYFRGNQGAYTLDDVSKIIPCMEEFGVKDKYYDDWLFVFGTAVGAFESDESGKKAEVHNFTPIRKGGAFKHYATKQYIAQLDYLKGKDYKGGVTLPSSPGVKKPVKPKVSRSTDERMFGGGIFYVDGIHFGVEICVDHAEARLERYHTLQVLLVPSCGMYINRCPALPGSIVFNVNGQQEKLCRTAVAVANEKLDGTNPRDAYALNPHSRTPVASKGVQCLQGGTVDIYDPIAIAWV